MDRDKENIGLIAEAALKINRFLEGVDIQLFLEDEKTQSAVIMQLVVIGELAKKVSEEAKSKIDLPWRMIAGFRDLAVHEYFQLDLHKVLETAVKNIPELLEKIRK